MKWHLIEWVSWIDWIAFPVAVWWVRSHGKLCPTYTLALPVAMATRSKPCERSLLCSNSMRETRRDHHKKYTHEKFTIFFRCPLRFSSLHPEDGSSMFLSNVDIYLQVHTALLTQKINMEQYRICACISLTFLTRIYPPKLGFGSYTEYCPFDDWARDVGIVCCETPSRDS
jgi:hypothetical protein